MKIKLVILLFSYAILGCNNKSDKPIESVTEVKKVKPAVFPKLENVSELKKTDFVPTLESQFNVKKNAIYGATVPMVWNEIRNELGETITNIQSKQLREIHSTKSSENVLNKNEYKAYVKINGSEISARAYFRKSFPFEKPLHKFEEPLTFKHNSVESFGLTYPSYQISINYFNSESDFSVMLHPINKEHKIILVLCPKKLNSFSDYFESYQAKKELNKNRIRFNDEDRLEIPIIEFQLDKIFTQISSTSFQSKQQKYWVQRYYQRNAFVLNERGAEVESYAEAAADAAAIMEKPEPKKMIFDKPFAVFLKKKNAMHPYFGVYIANEELLKKAN